MVFNNKFYNSNVLYTDINSFKSLFPFIETGIIGYSVLGKPIPYIKIGNGPNKVLYAASFHANEFITTNILMKFTYDMANSFKSNFTIWGYNARNILAYASIYIVPLINPDGVDLVTGSINNGPIFNDAKRIASNYPEIPFPLGWKANIRGVDLNLQFPARLV